MCGGDGLRRGLAPMRSVAFFPVSAAIEDEAAAEVGEVEEGHRRRAIALVASAATSAQRRNEFMEVEEEVANNVIFLRGVLCQRKKVVMDLKVWKLAGSRRAQFLLGAGWCCSAWFRFVSFRWV